jgi:NAD(P)-dependent dehydrogenase (short-subunit alcohol dehydrogenase family)
MKRPREPLLPSLGDAFNAVVVGATGGLGGAFVDALVSEPGCERLFCASRWPGNDYPEEESARAVQLAIDIEDEGSVASAAEAVGAQAGEIHLVLVAKGILHDDGALQPEKSWKHVNADSLDRVFRINAIGPSLVAKHFLPMLADGRKAVYATLSARVGSISDNRLGGWHAYRASKAALNMLVKTGAIELSRHKSDALCVALHPSTVDTRLSGPFQRNIPSRTMVSPEIAAIRMLKVVDALAPSDSGCLKI